MSDQVRDAFEAWAVGQRMSIERFDPGIHPNEPNWEEFHNRDYFTFHSEEQWRVWQASRLAALEEAAKACEEIGDKYGEDEGGRWPELKSDAQTGARDCESAIRAIANPTTERPAKDQP